MLRTLLASLLTTLLLSPASRAWADDTQILEQIESQLEQLKSFEFGQSADVARKLEQTIFQIPANSQLRIDTERTLLNALADANALARGVICRQLRVIGTDQSVSAIAPLLLDENLSPFARYALEGIGSDLALKAMHDALDQLPSHLQVGVLNSLAAQSYAPMREDCERLLNVEDAYVSSAAAGALGELGGEASVNVLSSRRPAASSQLGGAIDLALLDCAEQLRRAGENQSAAEIYRGLFKADGAFKLAGLQGLVVTQPNEATSLLIQAIHDEDERLAAAAINLAGQATDQDATLRFVNLLEELSDHRRILLIRALGQRGDPSAVPAVTAAVQNPIPEVQRAAIDALGGLSGKDAVDALLEVASSGDAAPARLARTSLTRIDSANAYLANVAQTSESNAIAVAAIDALAARKAYDQSDLMLELARGRQPARRAAALVALGVLAGEDEVDSLVDLALSLEDSKELTTLEESLGRALGRIGSPQGRAHPLLEALSSSPQDRQPLLIRQLARAPTQEALRWVRHALTNRNSQITAAAIESLSNWPDDAVRDDLAQLIDSAPNAPLKQRALDGYIRIATNSDKTSSMFLTLLNQVSSIETKKQVLNQIGLNCESFESIDATQAFYDDANLRAVAAIATVRIAYKLRQQHKDRVREVIVNVLARIDHPDVQKRAQEVLNDLDKYDDHILNWVAVGPFVDQAITSGEASFKTAFEPEQVTTDDLAWKPITLGIGSWDINLEATYSAIDHCSAYVRTMVWSPKDQDIQVEAGSDDALKIWLNGKQIHQQWRTGGCSPRQVLAAAHLQKGWNELKLKVTDHQGGWQFGCRIRKPDGSRLDGLKYEAR